MSMATTRPMGKEGYENGAFLVCVAPNMVSTNMNVSHTSTTTPLNGVTFGCKAVTAKVSWYPSGVMLKRKERNSSFWRQSIIVHTVLCILTLSLLPVINNVSSR